MTLALYGCEALRGNGNKSAMSDESKAILDFLNCDYEMASTQRGQKGIVDRFNALTERGKAEGFTPLIIIPSATLADFIENGAIEDTPESAAAHRQTVIDAANEIDGRAFLSARFDEVQELYDEIQDAFQDDFADIEQASPWDTLYVHGLESCNEVIIAKIPTENPWELAIWVPMGGYNECPYPEEQAAVFRYWFEKYGAVPAVVTHDTWQMTLTRPPSTMEEAEVLGQEQFAFCFDIIPMPSMLKGASMWSFWWD